MCRFLVNLVNKCEVKFTDQKRGDEFYASLRELVSILFAVIFGMGFSELEDIKGLSDFASLSLAYIAVVLSWWGYHWGTAKGPRETNVLNYIIDCLLLGVYWYLINVRTPINRVLWCYSLMFFFYWTWELVRSCKQDIPESYKYIVNHARGVNFLFFLWAIILSISQDWKWLKSYEMNNIYMALIAILIITYRIWIHRAYKISIKPESPRTITEEELIELAKISACNARTPLSNYKVGAAILSNSGNKYRGCNIEFDNYSNTIHAEEAAISNFIVAGEKEAIMIAVFTFGQEVAFPCGMCRQSLYELGGPELKVIACNETGHEIKTIGELLPNGFRL